MTPEILTRYDTFAIVITPEQLASKVVAHMYDNDPFSKWLGIERNKVAPGVCILQMTVRNEMLNGFSIAHGGITYALADSCLAFASNSYGVQAVSVETSISHTRPVKEGDRLRAVAIEMSRTSRIAIYHVNVTDQNNTLVALFKGTVYRTGKLWFPEDQPNPIS